jgi:hypothetical protein
VSHDWGQQYHGSFHGFIRCEANEESSMRLDHKTPAILHWGRNSSFFILYFSLLVAQAPRKKGKRKKEKGKMLRLSSQLRIADKTQIVYRSGTGDWL